MVELPVQVERGDLGRVPLEIGEVEVIGQSLLFPWKPVHKSINRRNNESWNVSGNVQGEQGESAFSLYANNTLVFFDPTSRGKFLLFSRGNIFAPPFQGREDTRTRINERIYILNPKTRELESNFHFRDNVESFGKKSSPSP